jgi:hypothetical protein
VATIDGIRRTAASTGAGVRARTTSGGETATVAAGRALLVVEPAARTAPPSITSQRCSADFLAHLIAIDQQAPQTRTRRRAEPAQVSLAYQAAGRLTTPVRPPLLSKAF